MKSLFSRLLQFQQTDSRSNLENYCTEILCDFLNRLSLEGTIEFLEMVFGLPQVVARNSFGISDEKDDLQTKGVNWFSRYPIIIEGTQKWPDLVCSCEGKTAVIVEVKINAGFTHRESRKEPGNHFLVPQLVDYGAWLAGANSDGILALLTHTTPPPIDFLEENNRYKVQQRACSNWFRVYRWLSTSRICGSIQLSHDFKKFLVEENMASESPSREDFAVLDLFVSGAGRRIKDLMKYVRGELQKEFTKGFRWGVETKLLGDSDYHIEYQAKAVWSWSVIDSTEYSYLSWGIIYPEDNDPWELKTQIHGLPKKPFFFVALMACSKNVEEKYGMTVEVRPKGWLWNTSALDSDEEKVLGIKSRDLSDLLQFDKDSTREVLEFVREGFLEVHDLIMRIT